MKEYNIPALKKYLYHILYVHVLSKNMCGKRRSEGCFTKLGDILSIREYAKHLSTHIIERYNLIILETVGCCKLKVVI